jgi:hypothetical protein
MQIQVLGRTALLIAISGTAGFLAGRSSTSPPLQVSTINPAPPRAVTAEQKTPGTLSKEPKPSEAKSGVAPGGEASHVTTKKLSELLSRLTENPDFSKIGNDIGAWFAANPDETLAYLANSPERDAVFSQLFTLWSKKDPHAASLWLAEHPEAPGRDDMAAGLASGVAAEDSAAAMQWVTAIKDPVIKLNAGREAAWEIYRNNEEDAAAALIKAGIPESALPSIQAAWQKRFSATVTRLTRSLVYTAKAAEAAGASFKSSNVDDLFTRMTNGVKGEGQFDLTRFDVDTSGWTSRESSAVKQSIIITDGGVRFIPSMETENQQ